LEFAISRLRDGATARDTLAHMVFEEQPASLRQILVQVRWNECLEILTAPELVDPEIGSGRRGHRTPDTINSLGNNLIVHVFVANVTE